MILIAEEMAGVGIQRLSTSHEVHYDPLLWQSADNLGRWIGQAEAIIVRNQTPVTAALLQQAEILKVVGRLGVGLDNIDLAAARAQHITVVTAQGANAVAVAEYVFACLLRFTRDLETVGASVRQGAWNRGLGGTELFGKTLGLIGLGDIGQRIVLRARPFGLRVLAYDPWQLATRMATMELGVSLVSWQELLQSSDFISIHVPLTQQTRHLIDAVALSNMRTGAYLINTSRGGVVDEAALLNALRQGTLAGAALDVRNQEPPSTEDELCTLDRILLTPHIAGLTQEAGRRTAVMVAEDVLRILSGQPALSAV